MKKRLILAALLALALPSLSFSQETDALKARFRERLPALNELKAQGVIGENNRGYVEPLGSAPQSQDILQAENADRQALYSSIAASTGTTPELVGQRRALQIAAQEPSGHRLQDAQGNWVQKP